MQDHEYQHNFHTHTFRCKHAKGDVADYCEMAVARGMKTLGISDHSAMPDDRWLQARMNYIDLPEYTGAIDRAREEYPSLRVVKGMECEYVPEHRNWYEDELLGEYQFDYLIGAAHFFLDDEEKWVGTYGGTNSASALVQFANYNAAMMATGLFDFIAHPDLFGNCYEHWDANTEACSRDIIAAAAEYGVGLEVNALGIRKQAAKRPDNPYPLYPWRPFWEIAADYPVQVIVNADAHRPADLQGKAGEAFSIVTDLGLTHMDVDQLGVRTSARRHQASR
ncbi:MAG: histidinol-phosphatase [Proteobacteria bacterium]|jgi:histidinol-phosphatase (PHP family)|nr:histidinol-phosphatase [Pseudomonadota bacterium]MDA1298608.1 histidinol-phosphatase [Pseudomonadota bacterium]